MSIQLQDGRQYPLVAIIDFSYADFDASGVAELAAEIPGSARDVTLNLAITEAFNSATSDAIDVGDGTTDDAYVSGQNGQVVADADVAVSIPVMGSNSQFTLKWTGVGAAPTTGAGRLKIEYLQSGRANETADAVGVV